MPWPLSSLSLNSPLYESPVEFVVLEFADIPCAIGKSQCALAVEFVVLEFAGVVSATGEFQGALAVEFVILEFADILVAICER